MKILSRKITSTVLIIIAVTGILLMTSCQKNDPVISVLPENTYDKTLVVATDDDYWPYVYYDENGNLTGHDIELINIIANELNMNLVVNPMTWEESLDAVRAGDADAVLTCEYTGKEVDDGIMTTSPVKSDDFVVFSRNNITSLDELYHLRIGVMEGGNVLRSITGHGLESACIYYESNRAAFDALAAGKCDCVIVRYIIGLGILEEMGRSSNGIDGHISLSGSLSCIGVSENNVPLAGEVSSIVEKLRTDKTLESLNKKWIQAHYPEYTFRGFIERNLPIIFGAAAFLILAVVLIFLNQRRFYKKVIDVEKAYSGELEEARKKAEAANQAKSSFLFNMSHDIRTPMNAIIGFTELAQKHKDDPEKVDDCLDKVSSSSKHLLSLINDVLDMARIESGKLEFEEKIINIREASKPAMAIAYENAATRGLTLTLHSGPVGDEYIYGDPLKISQIALNIMSNAIKYTNPGGKIDVRVDGVPCDDPERLMCDLIVEDTGIGISEEFLARIFEPFERSANTTQTGIQGTGLGMAITKELVEKMGGQIWVESKLGEGTRVTVRFNFRRAAGECEETSCLSGEGEADEVILHGKRILLVEDNELNREIAEEILSDAGMIVDSAEDGDVAVEIMKNAREGQYDLILMDIQMPRMNGYDATRAIRNLPNEKISSIPIITMTANAFEEDKQNAINAGMNGHTAKPIDVKKLLKMLTDILK